MTKDESLFCKRIKELSELSDKRSRLVYTDFLNLNEQNIFLTLIKELKTPNYKFMGGYKAAERCIAVFIPKYYEEEELPISCLKIAPINSKYSDDLTHRDFLGGILNLGIERSKIGDIIINENVGYVFCNKNISYFIADNLIKIKHTNVKATICTEDNIDFTPKFQLISGTVSSLRLDAVLSLVFSTSRSSIIEFIQGKKVFINSKTIESNSHLLKEKDIISVRGLGKFSYQGIRNQTKKGRYHIIVHKFI